MPQQSSDQTGERRFQRLVETLDHAVVWEFDDTAQRYTFVSQHSKLVLGYEAEAAARIVQRFREYDEESLQRNAVHRKDITKLIALSEQGRRDIAQLLATEASVAAGIKEESVA